MNEYSIKDTRQEMLKLRAKLMAENPHITLAEELAPLMGEYQREYWRWQLENTLYKFF